MDGGHVWDTAVVNQDLHHVPEPFLYTGFERLAVRLKMEVVEKVAHHLEIVARSTDTKGHIIPHGWVGAIPDEALDHVEPAQLRRFDEWVPFGFIRRRTSVEQNNRHGRIVGSKPVQWDRLALECHGDLIEVVKESKQLEREELEAQPGIWRSDSTGCQCSSHWSLRVSGQW